jgi:hypothetical protein
MNPIDNIMALAHRWSLATYNKALGKEFEDFDEIQKALRTAIEQALARPYGYAGATVWIGDKTVTQVVTETQVKYEREPGQMITDAAQECLDLLANQVDAPQPQPKGKVASIGLEWTPCMKLPVVVHVRQQQQGEEHVSTREGITPVRPDDLIMRGVSGEEYPIGRAIFEQTYTLNVDTAPHPQPKQEPVKLPCCSYHDATAIKWNQFNGVVQCHNCGESYAPQPKPDDTDLLRQALEALRQCQFTTPPAQRKIVNAAIAAIRERLK